ncbi:MAG TPA: putative glycoside hydrolase [Candidatus Paceibacterota bacterium]|nr:putative glycoside hydrolase [Candidatus Paceibacterota bacterium]
MSERGDRASVAAWRTGVGLFLLFLFSALFLYSGAPSLTTISYEAASAGAATGTPAAATSTAPRGRVATHVPTPKPVRGIYMTSCVAGTPSLRAGLVKLIDETELNAVVIDIKSFDGYISFTPQSPELKGSVGGCHVRDMQDFIDQLHEKGIYVIGREASFQDQLMVKIHPEEAVKKASATSTVWRDYKGIAWIDASSRRHWDYLVSLAQEAHAIGFDEINFDYIRFPADGNMKDIWYPLSGTKEKPQVVRSFYEYLHQKLSPLGITISGDLFGMTTTNTDDLNIGQILEYGLANFDYVMPMVYPSHYPNGFLGYSDPNQHVYEVVKYSMDHAVARAAATSTTMFLPGARIGTSTPATYAKPAWPKDKLRPWLQDNNYPVPYTPEMVKAQIQAAYDAGLDSWSLWNAGNRYTRAALLPAGGELAPNQQR